MTGTVLLTGGVGFIGAHLAVRLLDEGFELDIVDNLSRGVHDTMLETLLVKRRANFHNIDLLTQNAVDRFGDDYEFIVHLAAIVGVKNVIQQPYRTLRDNVAILEAAIGLARRQKALRRLLFTSTSEVYAGSAFHLDPPFPTPEDTLLALPP